MITWQEWCYIIGGYLSGSILYSYLLPKALKGIDITAESPDGNPGTANAFTCAGIPIGILVLCMELLKGYLPVLLAAGTAAGALIGLLGGILVNRLKCLDLTKFM